MALRGNPPFTVGQFICGSVDPGLLVEDRQASDLSGIFRVGFAPGQVGVLGGIGRFMDRKWLRLRRNAELVFEGMMIRVHGILMPEGGKTEAAISLRPSGCTHGLTLLSQRTRKKWGTRRRSFG